MTLPEESMIVDVSVVVPVYRSARTLVELVSRVATVLEQEKLKWEMVLVDDSSPDDSWSILQTLADRNPQLRIIQLMRNFGQHNALMCGFHHSSGVVIITIDDDLQHEPESIPTLYRSLNALGADLVYGTYASKKHTIGRNLGSWLVNRFYQIVFRMPVIVTSFRAMRSELVRACLKYDLNFTYLDGLLAWNTQKIDMIQVPHHERVDGRSGYTIGKLVTLAMNLFTNFSLLPLHVVSFVGFCSAIGGLLLGAWYLIAAALSRITVPGYASIIVAVLVLGGLQLLSLGVMGEYLGRLHLNVNRKPQYTIRRTVEGGASLKPSRTSV